MNRLTIALISSSVLLLVLFLVTLERCNHEHNRVEARDAELAALTAAYKQRIIEAERRCDEVEAWYTNELSACKEAFDNCVETEAYVDELAEDDGKLLDELYRILGYK